MVGPLSAQPKLEPSAIALSDSCWFCPHWILDASSCSLLFPVHHHPLNQGFNPTPPPTLQHSWR